MNDIVRISKKDLVDFVLRQNTKRIRQTSIDFYRHTDDEKDFISLGIYQDSILFGVTAGAFSNQFGITLIDEQFRNKGYGTLLLQHKINFFREKKISYRTLVAEDNLQSRRMCEKVKLSIVDITEGTRSSGKYNIYHYIDKNYE